MADIKLADLRQIADIFDPSGSCAVGDYVVYQGLFHKCIAPHTGAWDASHFEATKIADEISDLKADLETKAEMDGAYEQMTVGNAEQLVSSIVETDEEPYLFRTAGVNAEIGNRENDTIVGVSLPWNQLVPNAEKNFTSTKTDTRTSIQLMFRLNASPYTSFLTKSISTVGLYSYIVKATATGNAHIIHSGLQNNLTFANSIPVINGRAYLLTMNFTGVDLSTVGGVVAKNIQLMDLTQMFGSTIADYIYSLEQATAGAGIAWFKKYFQKDYYEYNPVELISVSGVSAHKTVGFNQWDEVFEAGYWDITTGQKTSGGSWKRSANYIPCVPNTGYYFNATVPSSGSFGALLFYDADKNFIRALTSSGLVVNRVLTTPQNAHYMTFYAHGNYFNNPICINLHWDGERDGEYEPYTEHVYPLDSSLELRGIPKLDANNQLYYDGDTYESDGTVTRKYGIVDLGTLDWARTQSGLFNTESLRNLIKRPSSSTIVATWIISSMYTAVNSNDITGPNGTNPSPNIVMAVNPQGAMFFNNTSYTDAPTFKTAMSGVYLVYELATPTIEQAEPFTNPQIVDNWGTEEYITTSIVPVGHVTEYPVDLKAKIEASPNNPSSDGIYLLQYQNGEASYTPLASSATITNIISRLEALEGGSEE